MGINEVESAESTSLFQQLSALGHEQVVFCNDEKVGLRAIIAIHNTTLGPSLGGTRMWNYGSEEEAITDVLRLSRGMTFKAAVTGLNLGGGKAVIIGDERKIKTEAFMRRFGKFVDSLGGKYITAEDVNMKTRDMEYIAMETRFVTGLPEEMGGSGDPSPVTAYGTYMGIKAAAKNIFGKESLEGLKIGVQGVGQVGTYLVEHLVKENVKVCVTDIFEDKIKNITSRFKVEVVDSEQFYDLDMDIYSPCALGATLNDDTIPRLKCKVIAGGANNQLQDEIRHGYMLMDHDITYLPDFVINAGGLINVYLEYLGGYNRKRAYTMAEKIYDNCVDVMVYSKEHKLSPQEGAMEIANNRIKNIGKLKLTL